MTTDTGSALLEAHGAANVVGFTFFRRTRNGRRSYPQAIAPGHAVARCTDRALQLGGRTLPPAACAFLSGDDGRAGTTNTAIGRK